MDTKYIKQLARHVIVSRLNNLYIDKQTTHYAIVVGCLLKRGGFAVEIPPNAIIPVTRRSHSKCETHLQNGKVEWTFGSLFAGKL